MLLSIQIKFSGDGTSFSKNTNYVLLSFSFPSICEDVLAGTGNHTFAAVKLTENYDQLKAAFEPAIIEINEIIEQNGMWSTSDIIWK